MAVGGVVGVLVGRALEEVDGIEEGRSVLGDAVGFPLGL